VRQRTEWRNLLAVANDRRRLAQTARTAPISELRSGEKTAQRSAYSETHYLAKKTHTHIRYNNRFLFGDIAPHRRTPREALSEKIDVIQLAQCHCSVPARAACRRLITFLWRPRGGREQLPDRAGVDIRGRSSMLEFTIVVAAVIASCKDTALKLVLKTSLRTRTKINITGYSHVRFASCLWHSPIVCRCWLGMCNEKVCPSVPHSRCTSKRFKMSKYALHHTMIKRCL